MAHVEGEIIIKRSTEEVFDFVADERNEPLYNREMVRSELISEEPIGRDSRFWAELSMRGRPVEMTIKFTTFDRPRLLGSSSQLSNMRIEGVLTFESVPEGTRMHWSWNLHPKGFLKLMEPMIAWTGRRQEKTIWTGLKRYLERQETPAPQI